MSSQYLSCYPRTGFCIGQCMVMVLQLVAALSSDGVKLVVGQILETAAGGAEGVVELVVGIVHLIDTEHGP